MQQARQYRTKSVVPILRRDEAHETRLRPFQDAPFDATYDVCAGDDRVPSMPFVRRNVSDIGVR